MHARTHAQMHPLCLLCGGDGAAGIVRHVRDVLFDLLRVPLCICACMCMCGWAANSAFFGQRTFSTQLCDTHARPPTRPPVYLPARTPTHMHSRLPAHTHTHACPHTRTHTHPYVRTHARKPLCGVHGLPVCTRPSIAGDRESWNSTFAKCSSALSDQPPQHAANTPRTKASAVSSTECLCTGCMHVLKRAYLHVHVCT